MDQRPSVQCFPGNQHEGPHQPSDLRVEEEAGAWLRLLVSGYKSQKYSVSKSKQKDILSHKR